MPFSGRRQLLQFAVERITVEIGIVRVEAVIPQDEGNLGNRRPKLRPEADPDASGDEIGRVEGPRGARPYPFLVSF